MKNIQQFTDKRDSYGRFIKLRRFSCIGVMTFTGETIPCGKLVETDSRTKKRCEICAKKQMQQTNLKYIEKEKLRSRNRNNV
jgi:hypothetical protein